MTKRFFLPQEDTLVRELMAEAGWKCTTDFADSFDAMLFTGGEDVTPFLYGEKKHRTTFNNMFRDLREIGYVRDVDYTFPKVGICRGGQFLNVMSGGGMYQHVTDHTGMHKMKIKATDEMIDVTSTHHQMMIPDPEMGLVIAQANVASRKETPSRVLNYNMKERAFDDCEVVYYPHTNSLCYQPHPEYKITGMPKYNKENKEFFLECVDFYLFKAKDIVAEETKVVECH